MEEKILAGLGKKIRNFRSKQELSQHELATQCKFERATMCRIESGKSNPTVRTLAKISTALNIPLSELFAEPELQPQSFYQV